MCNTNCPHKTDSMCSCRLAKLEGLVIDDPLEALIHMSMYLKDAVWELDYATLDDPGEYRLCVVGACQRCGGRLCMSVEKTGGLSGNDLLASMYRHLYQLNGKFGPRLAYSDFRERFVRLFHEQDRSFIQAWLERPENRSAHTMYRRRAEAATPEPEDAAVYTIVRTGADADRGYFPQPQAEGSYLSLRRARLELYRLIQAEKEKLDGRYDSEERDEDYWEACQKDYAAALFSRFEILRSELIVTSEVESPESFKPSDYLEQCAECFEQYGTPCCKDEESECGMLDEARDEQLDILKEESDVQQRFSRMWRMAKNSQDLEVE